MTHVLHTCVLVIGMKVCLGHVRLIAWRAGVFESSPGDCVALAGDSVSAKLVAARSVGSLRFWV